MPRKRKLNKAPGTRGAAQRQVEIVKITPRMERFVEEYVVDLNATAAARRAGYSAASAHVQGERLLRHAEIAQRIQARQQALSASTNITAERVLREYARLAFLDIRKAFDAEGRLKPVRDLDDDTAAAIAGMDIESETAKDGTVTRTAKLKFTDKKGALDSLSRHLGICKEQNSGQQNFVAFKVYLGFNPEDV